MYSLCNINTMGKVTAAQPAPFFCIGQGRLQTWEVPPAGASRKGHTGT